MDITQKNVDILRRSCSVGAALVASGAQFQHDFDVIVPRERGDADAHVAIAFYKDRLVTCSATMRHLHESHPETTHTTLKVPEAHEASVKHVLGALVPPCKVPPLDPGLGVDVRNLAEYLQVGARYTAICAAAMADSLSRLSADNWQAALALSKGASFEPVQNAVCRFLSTNPAARSGLNAMDAESFAAILSNPNLCVHPHTLFKLTEAWCAAHPKDGMTPAGTLRAYGLHRPIRWHALSEDFLDQAASQGYLAPAEYDEIVALRDRFRGGPAVFHPREVRVETLDHTYLPYRGDWTCLQREEGHVYHRFSSVKVGVKLLWPWRLDFAPLPPWVCRDDTVYLYDRKLVIKEAPRCNGKLVVTLDGEQFIQPFKAGERVEFMWPASLQEAGLLELKIELD